MTIYELLPTWRSKSGKAFGSILRGIEKNNQILSELNQLTEFLDSTYSVISLQQRFYHVWFSHITIEVCPYCQSPKEFSKIPKFSIDRYGEKTTNPVNYYHTCSDVVCKKRYNADRTKEAMLEKYGVENISQTKQWHDKVKATTQEKYGCDYQTQSKNFIDKSKLTCQEKYGTDHHTQVESVQDKKRDTVRMKYGVDHVLQDPTVMSKLQATNTERYGGVSSMCSPEVKQKSKDTNKMKYGHEWYVQSDEFKEKFKNTMLERYGVEHIMQYTPSFQNNKSTQFKWKLYMFPSGRLEKIQGYEAFAINELLDLGYAEDDIVILNSDIESYTGKIWYDDSVGKRRKYYPDIYIKSENKVIEVKSEYTYKVGYSINIRKKSATESLGINFEFWIYNKNTERAVNPKIA